MSDKADNNDDEQLEDLNREIDFRNPDVDNRRRTEHLLQEALDTFPDHVILYDVDDRVVFTNDRYHEVYPHLPPKDKIIGCTQEHLLRMSLESGLIDDPVAKSDPDAWIAMRVAKGRGKKNMGRVDGETTDSSGRSYLYRNRQTSEGGLVLVQTDITERKRAEEASRQLSTAIGTLNECLAIYDADDRLVFWNDAYWNHHQGELQKLLKPGLKLEDLVRARAYSGEAPGAIGQEESYIAQRMERHRNPGQQFETRRKNGWFVYRESLTPDGGTIIVITDITNIKLAEELKAQSELIGLLQKIATGSNKATDFFEALRTCLSTVIEFTGWPVGHIYCVSGDGNDHMVSSGIWQLDDPDRFAAFRKITERTKILEGDAFVTRAFATGQPVWIADVTKHPTYSRLGETGQDIQVRAGFALPISSQDKVVAVMEFYSDEVLEQDDKLMQSLVHIGVQLSRVAERTQAATVLQKALNDLTSEVFSRKRAEKTIKDNEKIVRDVLENVSQGVAMFDADKNLMAWNKHFQEIPLHPEGMLVIGRPIREMIYEIAKRGAYGEGDANEITDARVEHLWDGDTTRSDIIFRNDRSYDVITQRTQDGGLVITFSDITERKQVEEEVEAQRDELERLNDQKNKFFSIIAHDLKGPFNALLGYSTLLSSKDNKFDQVKIAEYSDALHQSAGRVFKLLENLLDWSRLQMGQLEFEPGPVDLKEIIDTNLALFESIAKGKAVRLTSKRRKPLSVFADAYMVDTVVRNLVNNAIKFTSDNGDVTVSARANGKWAEIEVSDSGIGIPADKVARLFLLGEKTSTMGTAGESGTGLGLLLCKDLVEKQGGRIHAKSSKSEGSVFRFTLPLHPR